MLISRQRVYEQYKSEGQKKASPAPDPDTQSQVEKLKAEVAKFKKEAEDAKKQAENAMSEGDSHWKARYEALLQRVAGFQHLR